MNFTFLETAAANTSMWSSVIMMALIIVVFWFFIIRPQRKKDKETAKMRSELQVGDEIVTIGGIIGIIVSMKEDSLVIPVDVGGVEDQRPERQQQLGQAQGGPQAQVVRGPAPIRLPHRQGGLLRAGQVVVQPGVEPRLGVGPPAAGHGRAALVDQPLPALEAERSGGLRHLR